MTGETPGRLIAAGNVAEVFEWGPRVVKLYRSPGAKQVAFREAATHAAVEALDLPVPAVWGVHPVDERWGIVFDRIHTAPLAEHMENDPARLPERLAGLARLHGRIHARAVPHFVSFKRRLSTAVGRADALDERDKAGLLSGLAAMPDGDRLCHGDFHPSNVLGDVTDPVIIDWPDACRGDPAADICRSWLLLNLHAEDIATPYRDAYCTANGMTPERVEAWLPYIAAARLAENTDGETDRLLHIVRAAYDETTSA